MSQQVNELLRNWSNKKAQFRCFLKRAEPNFRWSHSELALSAFDTAKWNNKSYVNPVNLSISSTLETGFKFVIFVFFPYRHHHLKNGLTPIKRKFSRSDTKLFVIIVFGFPHLSFIRLLWNLASSYSNQSWRCNIKRISRGTLALTSKPQTLFLCNETHRKGKLCKQSWVSFFYLFCLQCYYVISLGRENNGRWKYDKRCWKRSAKIIECFVAKAAELKYLI